MQEAEALALALTPTRARPRRQPAPMLQRGLQQVVGADDVGLDESTRAVDGAVDMGLGGQVQHGGGAELGEDPRHGRGVPDIGPNEMVARAIGHRGHVGQVAGIAQVIEIDDRRLGLPDQAAHHRRSDEPGTAGHEDGRSHGKASLRKPHGVAGQSYSKR